MIWAFMFRPFVRLGVAVALVLGILLGLATCQGDTKFDTHCGAWAEDTMTQKLLDGAEQNGTDFRVKMLENVDQAATATRTQHWMASYKLRTVATILSWVNTAKGLPAPAAATGIRIRTEEAQAAAVAACCPTVPADPNPPPGTPPVDPGPPVDKVQAASFSGGKRLKGPDLAADAAIKAGFPRSEIPMAVAVAKRESTWNPDPPHPPVVGGSTMRGMWQINERAHPKEMQFGDWRDPYVNARMAYSVWKLGDGTGPRSWHPWSTWRTAKAEKGAYARYASIAPSTPSDPRAQMPKPNVPPAQPNIPPGAEAHPIPPAPNTPTGCVTGGGGGAAPTSLGVGSTGNGSLAGVTVGTWNVLASNSPGRINANATFADVVGLQEVRHNGALPPPGYGVTDGSMAVPIIWNKATLDLVAWKRETAFGSGQHVEYSPSDHQSTVGPKSVVWAVFENRTTRKRFAAINTHMLVGTRVGNRPRRQALWDRQARKVNEVRAMLQAKGYPVVILGDFNKGPVTIRSTFGGYMAGNGIDQVLAFGAKPSKDQMQPRNGSDHQGVKVWFDTTTGRTPSSNPVAPHGGNIRTVVDRGKTYRIPIPAGPEGVAINYALDQLGKPYVFGTHGPRTFDCSGLVSAAYKKAGFSVYPQTSVMHRQEPRATGAPLPGDLWGHDANNGHVQMYLGMIDGKATVVEAANPRAGIRIDQSGWMNIQWRLRPTAGAQA